MKVHYPLYPFVDGDFKNPAKFATAFPILSMYQERHFPRVSTKRALTLYGNVKV